MQPTQRNARPPRERRAFSLLELTAVVAIVGLMSGMALARWGDYALRTTSADGFVRSVQLAFHVARRQAICEGKPAAVVLNRTGGVVTSIQVVRVGSPDVPTEAELVTPGNVAVPASADRWEFDYTGSLTTPVAGGSVGVEDGDWNWSLTINPVTGHVTYLKER